MEFSQQEIGRAKASLKMQIVKYLIKVDKRYLNDNTFPCSNCCKYKYCNIHLYFLDDCELLNNYKKIEDNNRDLFKEFQKQANRIIRKHKDILDLKLLIFKIKNHETSKQ